VSRNYSQKELRLLYTRSGNVCAFTGCNEQLTELPASDDDDAVNTSDIAHIVADSRQGPRGREELSEEDRAKYTNLILLCPVHHRIVDNQKNTYSVAVLRQMKADHEARVAKLLENAAIAKPQMLEEMLHSTMLPLSHLPGSVFSAPCKYGDDFDKVKENIYYPENDRQQLFPFILRDGRLYAFQDLTRRDNAFRDSMNWQQASGTPSETFWADSEGSRRFVDLLNRSLRKYVGRDRIWWDKDHYRYYFPVNVEGEERVVVYRPLNASETDRKVAWCPRKKSTGEPRNFWWHLAAGLRFEHVAAKQWYVSIRPERHLTQDGKTPMPSEKIGPRVTRLKARMFNDKYLAEVQFWRDVLCEGQPRLIMNFTDQSLICESTLVTCSVQWPGVPDDEKAFKNQQYGDDLFSLADLDRALADGEDEDEAFDDDDYDEEDEDETKAPST
jgi:hypothetical protein